MRAEHIASHHLRSNMGQGSTQTVVIKNTNSLKYSPIIFNIDSVDSIISDPIDCVPQGFRGAVLRIHRQGEPPGSV